jgi:large subunit ribosomal protein L4
VLESAVATEAKTAGLKSRLEKLGLTSALIIAGNEVDANFARAARNIPNIDVLPAAGINVYDIIRCKTLVLTKDAIAALEARFTGDAAANA